MKNVVLIPSAEKGFSLLQVKASGKP